MSIEKAVNRIRWRLNGNGWKANENDVEAINKIIEYVNCKEKEQFNSHELFSKLYIHVYADFRRKYATPIKELHQLLEQPLSVHIQRFTSKLNDIEVENLFDDLKLSKNHPATIPQEIKDKETDVLKEALKDKEVENKLFRNVWSPKRVQELLSTQINNFLNMYYYDKTDR